MFVPERPVTKGIGQHMSEMMSVCRRNVRKQDVRPGTAVPCEAYDHDDRAKNDQCHVKR